MKKVLTMIISVMLLLSLTIPAMAASDNVKFSNNSEVKEEKTIILKKIPKEQIEQHKEKQKNIMPKSIIIPTKIWNVATQGTYSFSGSSYSQTLYTNYRFTGDTNYWVEVNNYEDHDLTIKAKNDNTTYNTTTVPAGFTMYYNVYTGDSSANFYLRFSAGGYSMDFDGNVSE